MFPGETNEYRSFLIQPDIMLSSGDYDLRSKAMDGRGQESPWVVNDEAFAKTLG